MSKFQIYKKHPPNPQNINASKELPNYERTFNIHLQYLKQKFELFKSMNIKSKEHN
jgi:hypothetical protein